MANKMNIQGKTKVQKETVEEFHKNNTGKQQVGESAGKTDRGQRGCLNKAIYTR